MDRGPNRTGNSGRSQHRSRVRNAIAGLVTAALVGVCPLRAEADEGPDIPVDGIRPETMRGLLRAWPLAVHGARGTSAEVLRDTLADAFRALSDLRTRFALPDPVPDGTRGGGPELDLYLVDPSASLRAAGGADAAFDTLEHAALWDRASSFVVVDRTLEPEPRRHAITAAIARALLLGIDARIPRTLCLALAETFARRLDETRLDRDALGAFQHTSDAALLRDRDDLSARGASLFTDYLAQRFDRDDLVGLSALAWMPVVHTPPERDRFVPSPHVFDVLERTLRDAPGGLRGVVADFTVARGLAGTSADSLGYPGVGLDPDDPRLRPAPWMAARLSELPLWITSPRPLDETGASYLALDTHGAGEAALNLWLHAAPWREWVVTVLRIGEDGTLVGTLPRTPVVHGEWNTIVENLDRTARLLVVVNDFGNGHLDPYEGPSRNGFFSIHVARR